MELALLRAGRLAGLERDELLNKSPEIVEHAFDTTTKMMATVHHNDGAYVFAMKGAPEAVLAKAQWIAGKDNDAVMDEAMRAEWLARVDKFGAEGLRVLVAVRNEQEQALSAQGVPLAVVRSERRSAASARGPVVRTGRRPRPVRLRPRTTPRMIKAQAC